ncbi:MAG: electron transport complex subunit RsxC [Kiritimatiellia bacterium]
MKTIQASVKQKGGVHPACRKSATRDKPVREMPLPETLTVSMAQHMGAPAGPVVKKGDSVLRGQLIGEAAGFISAAVHAPTSGTVESVKGAPTPSGSPATAVTIKPDGEDKWTPDLKQCPDYEKTDPRELVSMAAGAGLAGMGGAGFPTHVKLSPPPGKPIDILIINGAECEPYLTADHRLMVENAGDIVAGCAVLRHILGAQTVRIAVEDNKPEAIAAMSKAAAGMEGDVAVVVLESKYPKGAEKQLIYSITGREVPSGGLPMDVGTLAENVGTTVAVRDAVVHGRPLTERITTVTGPQVNEPSNVRTRLGVSYADLIDFCGGLPGTPGKVISGGPMMGLAQGATNVSVTKTTSGILVLPPESVYEYDPLPCIGCGRCVEACPVYLMPCELSLMIEAEDYESAEAYNVMDCIECGCCAYECPAHRPLVQHMRQGKAWVAARRRAEKEKK